MMSHPLLSSFKLGRYSAPNRMVMAPMTRTRAEADGTPPSLTATYYAQRASAGLIVTECTKISEQAHGIVNGPGIYNAAQIAGWRKVVSSVHEAGGRIFLQLWHCGRVSHGRIRNGELPVAPSALPAAGKFRWPGGELDFEAPRALELHEITAVVDDFRKAAASALVAGFDGVELHGSYGYLVDEFLQDGANQRGDRYGGSVANRCRFALEVMEALVDVWGADRVGIKISPSTRVYGMIDSDAPATFSYLVRALNTLKVGYLHVMEPDVADIATGTVQIRETTKLFRELFQQVMITNVGYTQATGNAVIAAGTADLVSFGKLFLANPDLPRRFADDAPLNPWDYTTFYGRGEKGYTDYPGLATASAGR
jgi:N-ethylmaleimide reductase